MDLSSLLSPDEVYHKMLPLTMDTFLPPPLPFPSPVKSEIGHIPRMERSIAHVIGEKLLVLVSIVMDVISRIFHWVFPLDNDVELLTDECHKQTGELILQLTDPNLIPASEVSMEALLTSLQRWEELEAEFMRYRQVLEDFDQQIFSQQFLAKAKLASLRTNLETTVADVREKLLKFSDLFQKALEEKSAALFAPSLSIKKGNSKVLDFYKAVKGWKALTHRAPSQSAREEEWLNKCLPYLSLNQLKKTLSFSGTRGIGLRNLGATCYMNAFLQIFLHHPPILRACLHAAKQNTQEKAWVSVFEAFEKVYFAVENLKAPLPSLVQEQDNRFVSVFRNLFHVSSPEIAKRNRDLYGALRGFFRAMKESQQFPILNASHEGEQHDPNEFVGILLEAVGLGFPVRKQSYQKVENREVLAGLAVEETLSCLFLQFGENTVESSCPFEILLRASFEDEPVDFPYKYRWQLTKPPKILPFLAKRTGYNQEKKKSYKISTPIHLAIEKPLDMTPYCSNSLEKSEETTYYLTGFYVHNGSSSSWGHYVTVIRESYDRWALYDDQKVTKMSTEEAEKLWERGAYGGILTQQKELHYS